ncbi:hypothetical protein D3C84_1070700 [compost metagenome]
MGHTLSFNQGLTQGIDTFASDTGQWKLCSIGIGPSRQQETDLRLNLKDPTRLNPIAFADGDQCPRNPQQLYDGQVFAGLRHHAVIGGNH